MGNLYTIGYSNKSISDFVTILNKYNINYVLDVRSTPFSKKFFEFNKDTIKKELEVYKITYHYMGNYLGGRTEDEQLLDYNNVLDYAKLSKQEYYMKGIESIILGLNKDNNIVLMCSEKDPINCHRGILISKTLKERGINVRHILNNDLCETQQDLEKQMLDIYFPNRNQTSIFEDSKDNDEELIEKCYILRNKDIAFKLKEDN